MSCPSIVLEGIDAPRYASLIATAGAQGLEIAGRSGNTSYQGFDFSWEFDESNQTLTLQCTNKPFFVPCSLIESKIRSLIG